jgi:hypothetical protein
MEVNRSSDLIDSVVAITKTAAWGILGDSDDAIEDLSPGTTNQPLCVTAQRAGMS